MSTLQNQNKWLVVMNLFFAHSNESDWEDLMLVYFESPHQYVIWLDMWRHILQKTMDMNGDKKCGIFQKTLFPVLTP